MADIYNLFADLVDEKYENIGDYFTEFFALSKKNDYVCDPLQSDDEISASLEMFGDGDVFERAKTVLDKDNYCLEAFYVFYKMADDYNLYLYFDSMFSQIDSYRYLSEYKKVAYKHILDEFVTFEMDLESYTQAAAIQEVMIRELKFIDEIESSRLAFIYAYQENLEALYDLYLAMSNPDEATHIILIATALKNNNEKIATTVLNNFVEDFKYGDYIDHPWDLEDIDDPEAKLMSDAIGASYRIIKSVPYFFHWCSDFKKSYDVKA